MLTKTERTKRKEVRTKIKRAQDMTHKEFLKFAKSVLNPQSKDRQKVGLMLEYPVDLRSSMEDKTRRAADSNARWVAFMNNAGTLCHVVCSGAEILVRVKFTYPIKHLSNYFMTQTVLKRVEDYIKIEGK